MLYLILNVLFALNFLDSKNQYATLDLAILYDSDYALSSRSIVTDLVRDSFERVEFLNFQTNPIELVKFDKLKYKNVLLISSSSQEWKNKSFLPEILKFTDIGGNLFFIRDKQNKDSFQLVLQLGFLDSNKESVIDHSSFKIKKSGNNSHTSVLIDPKHLCKSEVFFPEKISPILYEGQGFALDKTNPMTFSIMTASPNAYLADPNSEIKTFPFAIGTDIVLVGGVEMGNRARAVVVGSSKMFDNENVFETYNNPSGSVTKVNVGNLDLFVRLYQWVFQKIGVVRLTNPTHVLVSSGETLDEYVVNNFLEYKITLETIDDKGRWVPLILGDLQMELVRLSKFARVNYTHLGSGRYSVKFNTPDEIGTFGLRTRIKRVGYTYIDHQTKIILRPRKHNDYQRFLSGAYPYYLTAFSMMGLVFLLVLALLNQSEHKQKVE